MAASINQLGFFALRYASRIPSRRKAQLPNVPFRNLHATPVYRRRDEDSKDSEAPTEKKPFDFQASLDKDGRNYYDNLSPEEKVKMEEVARKLDDYMTSPDVEAELMGESSQAAYDVSTKFARFESKPHYTEKIKTGLMAMGEVDPQDSGEDEEFEGDDISSLAHGELEQHREMREYARIAAWEMPLLSSVFSSILSPDNPKLTSSVELTKPFTPPSKEKPLRFRYTTYMGETHPAAKKIVVEFCTRDLPDLTEAQRIKLIKLVGVRYNPETDIIKMSSEMFETQAQNKRYLGDLVDTLMIEAKDSTDTYEDVPLDFRHHKYKPEMEFPEAWKLTPERKAQLEAERQQKRVEERKREELGQLPDGLSVIEAALRAKPREEARVLVQAPGRPGGRGNRLRA